MKKWLLGILSFYPVLYIIFFIGTIISSFASPESMAGTFVTLIIMHFATMITVLGLMGYYIYHAVTINNLSSEMRIIWVIILLVANMVAFPIYWFLYIFKEQPKYQ